MPEKPTYEELEKRIQELEQAGFKHKRSCEALKESEEQFKALSEAAFEAIFLSEKGICVDQNQTAERMFGYTRAEAVGRHGTEWIALEDRAQVKNNMLSGYEEPYEVTALRKNGTTFSCEILGRQINYRGRTIRVTALRDITERKRAEHELVKSEERFRRIFENLQDVYYESALDGTILEVSPSIEKISIYKREELIGKSLYDIYNNPKERDEFVALILGKGMVNDYEIHLKDKDGTLHPCSITTSLMRDRQGKPEKLIGSMRDISERKQAEEEARLSEHRYRTLLGAIPDPVVVYDSEGRATYINDAFVQFYGWSREELIGGRPDIVPPEEIEATQAACRSTLEDGTIIFETKRWNKNRDLLDIQIRTAILRDQDLKHIATIVIHRDVTALKQAESALRKARDELEARVRKRTVELAKANEELNEYTYAVVHNVKAPFRAVQNYANFLIEDLGDRLKGGPEQFLNGMRRAINQANQQFNDLDGLYHIRQYAPEFEAVDMWALLDDIAAVHRMFSDRQLCIFEEWPVVRSEKFLLRQILSELIQNGFKYNRSEIKKVEVGWRQAAGSWLEVFVRDNGIGIDPQYHEHILHIFKRLHTDNEYEGTGIGLAIVRRAVNKIGGNLRIESIAGEGSTFVISLPSTVIEGGQTQSPMFSEISS